MDRAVSRFQSGHINLSTLKYTYTECKHAANGTISHVHYLAAIVKPSMISAMNYVQLALKIHSHTFHHQQVDVHA